MSETECSESIGFSNCDTESWMFEAKVYDNETGMCTNLFVWCKHNIIFCIDVGLRLVGVDYAGDDGILDIDSFDIGTNENVSVYLEVNCCVRKAILSMIDVAGNANRVEFDKGPLKGNFDSFQCWIIDFS